MARTRTVTIWESPRYIYPSELQLNKANSSDTEAPFWIFIFTISDGLVSSKIYDKHDDFDFYIVNFPYLYEDTPRARSNGDYISQLIRFAKCLVILLTLKLEIKFNFNSET